MHVLVQQSGQPPKSLLFHPWQSSIPDDSTSGVNATAVISTGRVTDTAKFAQSAYSLFMTNSSDEGTSSACLPCSHNVVICKDGPPSPQQQAHALMHVRVDGVNIPIARDNATMATAYHSKA